MQDDIDDVCLTLGRLLPLDNPDARYYGTADILTILEYFEHVQAQ